MKRIFFCLSFIIIFVFSGVGQVDSGLARQRDSMTTTTLQKMSVYNVLLDSNIFLNSRSLPVILPNIKKQQQNDASYFYALALLLLFLGILKTAFSRYFNTLFRVFFNTSLRQNQLTDQLEQARLPSLLFNTFFVVVIGFFASILIHYFILKENHPDWYLTGMCIAVVSTCYVVKYLTLKFAGWVTNYSAEAGVYIFIIFLLNKIIGILLLPFVILMLFSTTAIIGYAVFLSIITLAILLLLRFFRSYSLLQNKLAISSMHFLLYIVCIEIIPLALIYKLAMFFLGKNS